MAEKHAGRARFAATLKREREALGLTQAQFAKKVGLKLCNINAYEQARSRPQFETLKRIARFLDKNLEELV